MKLILVLLAPFALSSSLSFAASFIACGESVDFDNFQVGNFELAISSEDDNYTGVVGENWHLQLEEGDWLERTEKIVATPINGGKDLEILIGSNSDSGGDTEMVYLLVGVFDDEPILKKYIIRSLFERLHVGDFKCIGTID